MTIPLPNSAQSLSIADWDVISEHIKSKQAIVIGPGIGQDPSTAELVLQIYLTANCPVILDADALNILAETSAQTPALRRPKNIHSPPRRTWQITR